MADRIQDTRKIADGLYILNFGFVCSYILDAGSSVVAFDAGMAPAKVISESGKLRVDPARVGHVFLTHSDRDHVGGLPAFPNAKVHLPKDERAMLDRSTARFFGLFYNRPFDRDYEPLEDGQVLQIGNATIRCISTPGHTAGSMSFLVNGSIMIVGDELNLKDQAAVLDRGFISIDNRKRGESIRKLAGFAGARLLCTMHSGYSDDFEKAMEGWRGRSDPADRTAG